MEKILLKTDKLSKTFSSGGTLQHVLKNIDLELYRGSFTVIMHFQEWINHHWVQLHLGMKLYLA